jgi:hypothetical protein
MKIMWNIEKVTRSAQKTLRGMIIAASGRHWKLLSLEGTRRSWVKYEVLHRSDADGKTFGQNYLG